MKKSSARFFSSKKRSTIPVDPVAHMLCGIAEAFEKESQLLWDELQEAAPKFAYELTISASYPAERPKGGRIGEPIQQIPWSKDGDEGRLEYTKFLSSIIIDVVGRCELSLVKDKAPKASVGIDRIELKLHVAIEGHQLEKLKTALEQRLESCSIGGVEIRTQELT